MNRQISMYVIALLGLVAVVGRPAIATAADPDWKAVEQALGK